MNSTVLVVGGGGFFGRALVADLLEHSRAAIVVAHRRAKPTDRHPRLCRKPFDLTRPNGLEKYAAVVCCAGPFQGMPTTLVEAAAQAGVPYLDLADDRDFIARARKVRSTAIQMIGLSAVPGLTCLLAGRANVGHLRSIRTLIAPGSLPVRGGATLASMISGAHRWGARESVRFPGPVGRRFVQRTIQVGDLDVVPELFEGASFEFKVGFDLDLLNWGVHAVRLLPWVPAKAWMAVVRVLSVLGTSAGAVQVQVMGSHGTYVGSVTAGDRGYRIPIVLAGAAVSRILEGRLADSNLRTWLPDLGAELAKRRIRLEERWIVF